MTYSSASDELVFQLKAAGLPDPVPEYRFHDKRRWRFDFAWPEQLIALEIEGGVWVNGRHTRGKGFEEDIRKYNAAACLGWRVLRATPDMIRNGELLNTIEYALGMVRTPEYLGEGVS
jgi:hypothetical protein